MSNLVERLPSLLAKATPGPWTHQSANNYVGFSIAPLCRLPTLAAVQDENTRVFNFPEQTEANAELISLAPEMASLIESQQATINELVEALENLSHCEARYRVRHDTCGGGHMSTGRAWDKMRRAGEEARALLSKLKEQSK